MFAVNTTIKTTLLKFRYLLLLAALFVTSAHAAGEGLYDVDIAVVDESTEARQNAFATGLDEVFIRVAGDSIIMDKVKRPSASAYVSKFSYSPIDQPELNEDGEQLANLLHVQYNGKRIERYLREQNFPVWGEQRPDVALWLAVFDGRNQYVLRESDSSDLKAVTEDAMHRRGLPLSWPLFDRTDKNILGIADIRGGFEETITRASRRYTNGPALSASLRWNGSKWQSTWNLIMKDSSRHWSLESADYRVLISRAIDRAADAMGQVFAVSDIDAGHVFEVLRLDITSISDIVQYRRVEEYLNAMQAVDRVIPVGVDGDHARFDVSLRSSKSDFLNLVRNDARLVQLDIERPEPLGIEELEAQQGENAVPAGEKPADYTFRLLD